MKSDPVITKSLRLLGRGKYAAAIRLLESEAVRYRDSFRYYYILAAACLRAGDFGGAFTYFISARKLKKHDPGVLLGLAVLFLRRGDTVQAVEIYLEVQEIDPKNSRAKAALGIIRRQGNAGELGAWVESGKLKRLYPPIPRAPFGIAPLLPFLGCACVFAALAGILSVTGKLPFWKDRPEREGYAESFLAREELDAPVQTGGSYRYVLSRAEAVAAYEKARGLFGRYRDEEAKVEINRILESNAPEPLKTRAREILARTAAPDFTNLSHNFDYRTVARDPVLYRSCYVIWEGMAADLVSGENATSFNLYVGYDPKAQKAGVQGIVPVTFNAATHVNTRESLKVMGRVIPVSSAGEGYGPGLQGVAVYQSRLPVPGAE